MQSKHATPMAPHHASAVDTEAEQRLRLRQSAVACWYLSGGEDIRAAVELFKSRNPSHPQNCSRFIRTWVAAFEQRFNLAGPSSPGRPTKLPDEVAERAVEVVWRGYVSGGQRRYYRSIQQAVGANTELKAILKEHKISAVTLLRRMQAVEPKCRRRLHVVKRLLTAENKQQRQAACQKLLLWPLDQLQRTFWLDAATIIIAPKGMKVFAPPGAHLVLTDDRLPTHSSQVQKLRFYVCINAILGPVALKFITGTSDAGTEWLVSGLGRAGWSGVTGAGHARYITRRWAG